MTYLFNNCRNRDHSRYGEGAFFDLELRGRQTTLAKSLRSGDICIVASYGDAKVNFRWYTFAHEKRMLDEKGELVRVLFGRPGKSESLAKATAARVPPYAHFFDRNGNFKIVSVVRLDPSAPRQGTGAWAFPDWGKARTP